MYSINEINSENVGFDITSSNNYIVGPLKRCLIDSKISISLPNDKFLMVVPRSGLALNYGITILNSPGIIDPGYTGIIKIIIYNTSSNTFIVKKNMRIAQLILLDSNPFNIKNISNTIKNTNRGNNGFGSTGLF